MTDMIEKIARAMCDADENIWEYTVDEPCKDSEGFHGSMRDMYLAHAKAALTALEQPSDEMKRAGAQKFYEKFDPNIDPGESDFGSVFSAMIKAARGDQ